MENPREQLKELFVELDGAIGNMNIERAQKGIRTVSRAKVQLLGQVSLLANEKVSALLSLAQTGDLDAFLRMDHAVKTELKKLLPKFGLIYDEDSTLIWIPPGS